MKGKHDSREFGKRITGPREFAELIRQRFRITAKKLGLLPLKCNRLDRQQFRRVNEQLEPMNSWSQ
jgi:hypothetical protein